MAIKPIKSRLRAILKFIIKNPGKWDQSDWCGTRCCFAGHAQKAAGKRGDRRCVVRDARKWLGLTHYQANGLFSGGNSLEDLKDEVNELCNNPSHRIYEPLYDDQGYDGNGLDRNNHTRADNHKSK